jgi:putative aldouronate transport system permease protein
MSGAFKRKTAGEIAFKIVAYITMTIVSLTVLIPLLYVVQITFSTNASTTFRIWPSGFTLDHYKYVFRAGLITRQFINSLQVTSMGVVYSMVFTALMAYPLSRKNLVFRRFFNLLVIIPMLFSIGFLPKYLLVRKIGLMETYAAVILPYGISAFNLIILRNFFSSVPIELSESAKIDGASEVRTLIQIILPLSKAALATVALFYMVSYWNEYFNIILYINDPKKHTLQVILRSLVMENEDTGSSDDTLIRNIQYTAIVVAIIPVMIVYPALQKHFTKGIMLGSVKG